MTDTITIKPTFTHAAEIAIVALENGTPEGKAMARAEILRHACELDRLAGLPGTTAFDAEDTPTSED